MTEACEVHALSDASALRAWNGTVWIWACEACGVRIADCAVVMLREWSHRISGATPPRYRFTPRGQRRRGPRWKKSNTLAGEVGA